MNGTTVRVPAVHRQRSAPQGALSLVTAMIALATLGALLPAAAAAWTADGPPAVEPVSVRLDGVLSTAGLPRTPTVSRLTLHNDGRSHVRWALETSASGGARTAAVIDVWAAQGDDCRATGVRLKPGRWSSTTLEPGGSVPLCVRISDHGDVAGIVRPRVSVHARNA